jgi:hypothetical protein
LLLTNDASPAIDAVGAALPVAFEPEVKPEAEGEREPGEVDPPVDELPPETARPDVPVPREWPPRQEEEEEDEEEGEEELKLRLRLRSGRGPAGTASESRNTSPRMCSAFWEGTPDWPTGCVNTTCNPVAVTVSSPEPVVPAPASV